MEPSAFTGTSGLLFYLPSPPQYLWLHLHPPTPHMLRSGWFPHPRSLHGALTGRVKAKSRWCLGGGGPGLGYLWRPHPWGGGGPDLPLSSTGRAVKVVNNLQVEENVTTSSLDGVQGSNFLYTAYRLAPTTCWKWVVADAGFGEEVFSPEVMLARSTTSGKPLVDRQTMTGTYRASRSSYYLGQGPRVLFPPALPMTTRT